MTTTVIITFCSILLVAYLFDLSSSRTRIPSVILLLILGWLVRQVTGFFDLRLPDFSAALQIFGSIGLILIVLEGSLELELNRSKTGLIWRSFMGALIPMLITAFLLAWLFRYYGYYSLNDSLINAIPFCVISSAIAIPSVRNLTSSHREFVIYESSLSDILGVLFFNFLALNDNVSSDSFGRFGLQILVICVVSFVATIGLSLLLSKIEHQIKFVPIILLVILIYEVSKIYDLPALIFILMFGLFIGNFEELRHLRWLKMFKPAQLEKEVKKFKELTIEAAFLVRSLFFLLFGYLLELPDVVNTGTLFWSLIIVSVIFLLRTIQLKLSGLPLRPLLFVAPRGLITILLFLSIGIDQHIAIVNKSLIVQVIVLTALIMMVGLMTSKGTKDVTVKNPEPETMKDPESALNSHTS